MKISANTYNIHIEKNALSMSGVYAAEALGRTCRVVIVSDDNVYPLYGERLEQSLRESGFDVAPEFVIPHGEASKSMKSLEALLEHAAYNGLTRTDALFALGGGVVGDLAGFASAVYLRGIRYVQVPTSVLASVDSSVGGKTAVDLASGKNQAGAFHEPSLVICDTATLDTLTPLYFSDGMAEVIKYGFIGDAELLHLLDTYDVRHERMDEVIAMCVRDKLDVVSRDLYDNGIRQCLNLGHTIGHAVEALSDYTVPHGHAVALGMTAITRAAVRRGICGEETLSLLVALLEKYGLPTEIQSDYTAERLFEATLHDKKRRGGTITLVLPQRNCSSELVEYPTDELLSIIKDGLR